MLQNRTVCNWYELVVILNYLENVEINRTVMSYRKIFVWILVLIFVPIISVFTFYIYMIYGTHSWDEGGTHISCQEDPITHKMVLIEKTVIRNGEKVKIDGTDSECTS